MKRIWILLLCSLTLAAEAQVVTINVSGDRNKQVILNNAIYKIENNNLNNFSKNITIDNLRPGEYSLQLVRLNDDYPNDDKLNIKDNNLSFIRTTTTFSIKPGYDVAIVIAPNGLIQVKDKLIAGTASIPGTPLTEAAFTTLLNEIQFSWRNTRRITYAQGALTNNNNYFTTQQVSQIIQSIAGDDNRLALAKLAYNRITDPGNFNEVYNMLPVYSRNELGSFLRQSGVNLVLSFSETYTPAMNETSFENFIQNTKRNTDALLRFNLINQELSNETKYFTVAQVRRMVELIDFESRRLQVLKDAYPHVIDPNNYALLYTLLSTDDAKQELITYINVANKNGGLVNYNLNKPEMSETNFASLFATAKQDVQKGSIVYYLTNVFGDIANNFSSAQVAELLSLVDGELNRLSLAKTAYKTIIDPGNYLAIMNELLTLSSSKNELSEYAYSFTGNK